MIRAIYTPADFEEKHYQAWERDDLFKACNDLTTEHKTFSMMMPPPNITGELHIGHALTYTIQDTICRFKRMIGYDVLYQPGFDHAGIAVQSLVERQLEKQGLRISDMGSERFLEHIWTWKKETEDKISKQQRMLGISADWSRLRFTLDKESSLAVRKAFVDLYRDGLIYRSKRLVNWDPILLTTVSDLSVMSQEVDGKLWFIKYPIGAGVIDLTVATTRPETLFGDVAIAVHPDDSRYSQLVGLVARVPLTARFIPIISDEYSDPSKGTGAVRITPAHDFNDFEVSIRHKLGHVSIFDKSARLNNEVPLSFRGLYRLDARKKVIEELYKLGLLGHVEEVKHMVPLNEQSGVVLEPLLTDQWFVDTSSLAEQAMDAVRTGKVKILPRRYREDYDHWLKTIKPWCISRQIFWGHKIPAWYGLDQNVFVELSEDQAHDQARKHYGHEVHLKQDPDVLDTWFSSSLWPFLTLGWPHRKNELKRYYPTTVLITGEDIIFFWVARMIMMSLHFTHKVPFREVYLHPLVRDHLGQKMSKTKGNVINPLDLVNDYGCDALRLALASLSSPGREVRFSQHLVSGYRNFITKLWNIARFCEHHRCTLIQNFNPVEVRYPINMWVIGELAGLAKSVEKELGEYNLDRAALLIRRWTWTCFCSWYLEMAKLLLNEEGDRAVAKGTKQEISETSAWVLAMLCHLLHPFIPFITEEIWQVLSKKREAHIMENRWPFLGTGISDLVDQNLSEDLSWVMKLISSIRSARSKLKIEKNRLLSLLSKESDDNTNRRLKSFELIIKKLAYLKDVRYTTTSLTIMSREESREETTRTPSHFTLREGLVVLIDDLT